MNLPAIKDLCHVDGTDSASQLADRINDLLDNQRVIAEILARHNLVQLEWTLLDLQPETAAELALQPARFSKNKFKS